MHLFCSVWCVLHAEQFWAHSCITLPYKYAWEKSIARQFYCTNVTGCIRENKMAIMYQGYLIFWDHCYNLWSILITTSFCNICACRPLCTKIYVYIHISIYVYCTGMFIFITRITALLHVWNIIRKNQFICKFLVSKVSLT